MTAASRLFLPFFVCHCLIMLLALPYVSYVAGWLRAVAFPPVLHASPWETNSTIPVCFAFDLFLCIRLRLDLTEVLLSTASWKSADKHRTARRRWPSDTRLCRRSLGKWLCDTLHGKSWPQGLPTSLANEYEGSRSRGYHQSCPTNRGLDRRPHTLAGRVLGHKAVRCNLQLV